MTRIVGYTRKKEPKWFLLFLTLGLALLIVIIFLAATFLINWTTSLVKTWKVAVAKPTVTTQLTPTTLIIPEKEDAKKEEVVQGGGRIRVEKIVFSSGITGNLPIDSLKKVFVNGGRVYCYSRLVAAEVPRTVHHVWVGPEGTIAADIKLTISRIPSDLWSYINIGGCSPGAWELQIKDESGELIAKKSFAVD